MSSGSARAYICTWNWRIVQTSDLLVWFTIIFAPLVLIYQFQCSKFVLPKERNMEWYHIPCLTCTSFINSGSKYYNQTWLGLFTALFAFFKNIVYICQRTRLFGLFIYTINVYEIYLCYSFCSTFGLLRLLPFARNTKKLDSLANYFFYSKLIRWWFMQTSFAYSPSPCAYFLFSLSFFFSFSFGKYETERNRLLVNEIEKKLDNHNRKFGVGKTGDILLWLHAQCSYASFHMQFRR